MPVYDRIWVSAAWSKHDLHSGGGVMFAAGDSIVDCAEHDASKPLVRYGC